MTPIGFFLELRPPSGESALVLLAIVLFLMTLSGRMKKHSPSLWVGLPTLALLSMVLWFPAPSVGPASETATGGDRQVDLSGTFITPDGEEIRLADLDGKIFFINFWATWCAPCRLEMPSMAALYQQFRDSGLVMVAISDEDAATIRTFLDSNPYAFGILLDQGEDHSFARRHGVRALPTTLVSDPAGHLIFEHVGANNWDSPQMLEKFSQLLDQ